MTYPIKNLSNVAKFNEIRGQRTHHPLVTVLDQSKSLPFPAEKYFSELYILFIKDVKCADLIYGRSKYDYEEGTMVFIGPNQLMGIEDESELIVPNGWVLAFHPDLLLGTSLAKNITYYHFFSYEVNEALHLSFRERQVILDCFQKIQFELEQSIDKHSRKLIVSNIELLLGYCLRFYDRQFISREHISSETLVNFEKLLDSYFRGDNPMLSGIPSVAYFAEKLNLSSNYFGDLIKRETGKTAQEYIQNKIINLAKDKVLDKSKTISEVAYEIGFKYHQHFTRLFKQKVGMTPLEYRNLN
jgi:AraC family transcriptional activator of pobA